MEAVETKLGGEGDRLASARRGSLSAAKPPQVLVI
jgi:hypothetical protein